MKRSTVLTTLVLAAVIALVGAFAVGLSHRGISAQDTATEDHPIVGVWLADTDPENEANALETFTFHSDGSYISVGGDDTTVGAWEATGATTGTLTLVGYESDDEGNAFGSITIRATFEVGADGNSFTGQYTFEFTEPDGTASGQAGPGTVTGTRLMVEAPGTPVMTLEELFGAVEGTPEASPEATPTS
jgi:hypothetical protein